MRFRLETEHKRLDVPLPRADFDSVNAVLNVLLLGLLDNGGGVVFTDEVGLEV
jgi:hypothetical protein